MDARLFVRASRWVFYPLVVGGAAFVHHLWARTLPVEELYRVTGGIGAAVLVLSLLLERAAPFRADWNRGRGDFASDLVQSALVFPFIVRLTEVLMAGTLVWLAAAYHWRSVWPVDLPFTAQVVLAALVAEFAYYWLHRLSHAAPLLWRVHVVHHGATRVYSINSARFHPVDALLGTAAYLGPLFALGAPAEVLALVGTLSAATGVLEHVNLDYRGGVLNRIFNTAELHRWHHRADITRSSCNFGKMLSVWDTAFGTYHLPRDAVVGSVGVDDVAIPVPCDFPGQVRYPFQAGNFRPQSLSRY